MHIRIQSDASLPDHRLFVSADLDDELLATLEDSRFEVCVDMAQSPLSIRMSANLAGRLDSWRMLQHLLGADRDPLS
jgi:hypothetical protein